MWGVTVEVTVFCLPAVVLPGQEEEEGEEPEPPEPFEWTDE